jgi:hypothetical protein
MALPSQRRGRRQRAVGLEPRDEVPDVPAEILAVAPADADVEISPDAPPVFPGSRQKTLGGRPLRAT